MLHVRTDEIAERLRNAADWHEESANKSVNLLHMPRRHPAIRKRKRIARVLRQCARLIEKVGEKP